MHKVAIVYRSLTGNTEAISDEIQKHLHGCQIDVFAMDNFEAAILLQYDGILIGTYTWGNGDLPYDAQVLYKQLNRLDFSGRIVGCFGSGDRDYSNFCTAVEIFLDKVRERGAITVEQGLKIHLAPNHQQDFAQCASFATSFNALLNQKAFV